MPHPLIAPPAPSCAGRSDLFLDGTPGSTRQAQAICSTCPLLDPCRTEALRAEAGSGRHARHFVVGGLTPDERYDLDQQRIAAEAAAGPELQAAS